MFQHLPKRPGAIRGIIHLSAINLGHQVNPGDQPLRLTPSCHLLPSLLMRLAVRTCTFFWPIFVTMVATFICSHQEL